MPANVRLRDWPHPAKCAKVFARTDVFICRVARPPTRTPSPCTSPGRLTKNNLPRNRTTSHSMRHSSPTIPSHQAPVRCTSPAPRSVFPPPAAQFLPPAHFSGLPPAYSTKKRKKTEIPLATCTSPTPASPDQTPHELRALQTSFLSLSSPYASRHPAGTTHANTSPTSGGPYAAGVVSACITGHEESCTWACCE